MWCALALTFSPMTTGEKRGNKEEFLCHFSIEIAHYGKAVPWLHGSYFLEPMKIENKPSTQEPCYIYVGT